MMLIDIGCHIAHTQDVEEMRRLIAGRLGAAEFHGIHLYHCQPRGSFFMRKGPLCSPEFFVRQFGDTLMGAPASLRWATRS